MTSSVLDVPSAWPDLKGVQEPVIRCAPGYVSTSGPEVSELAEQAGLVLDPWQRLFLDDALGERPDGKWAAFEAGLVVARQNGKGSVFEAMVLGGLFLLDEQLIMYSAHEFKTAQEMFRRIEGLIAGGISAGLAKRVLRVSRSNGEEGIELRTGQRLRFMARSTGSGRGFSGDRNIWDEAQHLGDAPVDALMPTMSARPNPQLVYGGSAPDKDLAPCDQLARVRRRALAGTDRSLVYHEYSAELCTDECAHGCDLHDDPAAPETVAKTNPGLGYRITLEQTQRERASMSSAGYSRERLSVGNWPKDGAAWEVISEEAWAACADPESAPVGSIAIAADVTPLRGHGSIAIAGLRADGLSHVEVIEHRSGTTWMVPRLVELAVKWKPVRLVIDAGSPAGSLIPDLEAALEEAGIKLEVTSPTYREVAQACGQLYDMVVRPADTDPEWRTRLRHRNEAELNAALAEAQKRPLGEAWAWSRKTLNVVISPLVAGTLALWGFTTRPRELPKTPATAHTADQPDSNLFRPSGRLNL